MGWQDRAYNQDGGTGLRFGFVPPPPMALGLIVSCIFVFILQQFSDDFFYRHFALSFIDGSPLIQLWKFVTYQYLHKDAIHIFWNLLGIYFFVPPLERLWGPKRTFAFYTAGGVAGGILFAMLHAVFPADDAFLVGASGSILAALGACALLFPEQTVLLIVFPVPIRLLAVILALFFTLTVIG